MHPSRLLALLIAPAALLSAGAGDPNAPAPEPTPLETLHRQAAAMEPLVSSDLARSFLKATSALPSIAPRTVWRDKTTRKYMGQEEAAALPEAARAALEPVELDERFYYNTRYGTPLAYARPLELLSQAGLTGVSHRKILDFGYGSVGHLRLLASLGADVTGVEVDPLLKLLYAHAGDQGAIPGAGGGAAGHLKLVHGSFPSEAEVKAAVGDGYDLIVSKNVLKNGYIHPAEPVDPARLVHLGVDDEGFVRALHGILKPGGYVLIYNLSPAPAPPGKPYIPWADGRCPFPAALWEKAGFQVVAFDRDDSEAARAMAHALGWDQGPSPMNLEKDLFGHWTLVRKK
jgi:SAM-dependent methyltransferase